MTQKTYVYRTRFCWENLKERENLEDRGVVGNNTDIILKLGGRAWIGFT